MHEQCGRLTVYWVVLRRPGVLLPCLGTALASLPIGILSLALLLLVRQNGSFTAAGAVVAVFGIGTVLGILMQGRLLDDFGSQMTLPIAASVQTSVLVSLVVVARSGGPA